MEVCKSPEIYFLSERENGVGKPMGLLMSECGQWHPNVKCERLLNLGYSKNYIVPPKKSLLPRETPLPQSAHILHDSYILKSVYKGKITYR